MRNKRFMIAGALLSLAIAFPLTVNAVGVRTDRLPLPAKSEKATNPPIVQPDYSMWIGEVELRGKKRVWLELIDEYGEVVYDSEVIPNQTHVLPGGRMIVVRRSVEGKFIATKTINRRIASAFEMATTRRVVADADGVTTVEYIEPAKKAKSNDGESDLITISRMGQWIWQNIVAFFDATAQTVQIAWANIVDVLTV